MRESLVLVMGQSSVPCPGLGLGISSFIKFLQQSANLILTIPNWAHVGQYLPHQELLGGEADPAFFGGGGRNPEIGFF